MNVNTCRQRLLAWIAVLLGGYGSPALACQDRRATLRWVWTGRTEHAAYDERMLPRYLQSFFRPIPVVNVPRRSIRQVDWTSPAGGCELDT